jgi:hypothetical protein
MPQFVKTRAKGMDVFVNMNAIFTVTHGKGFADVTSTAGETIRLVGEDAARFIRSIERPPAQAEFRENTG